MKVKECMESGVWYVKPEDTIQDCAKLMSNYHIGCVPVCNNNNNIVGLVTDRDIILRCISWNKDWNSIPIKEIMTKDVYFCNENSEIEDAKKIMSDYQVRRVPVVNNENKITGIITLGDMVKNDVNQFNAYEVFDNICKCSRKNAE